MRPLHFRVFWLALGIALLVMVLYLTLSAPGLERRFPGGDKMAHASGFFALMFWYAALFERRFLILLGLALLALGGVIELAQGWMAIGRRAEWADFFANGVGIAVAAGVSLLSRHSWLQWVERRLLGRSAMTS
jgi:hypothetical protein